MTYQTLTASNDQTALVRLYQRLATGRSASDIDQWIDQLTPQQVRQLYLHEQINALPETSVLRVVCRQFLALTPGGRIAAEQLEDYYAAARQRVVERLEEK